MKRPIPDEIPRCPINQEIMVDPVIALDGRTYERDAIVKWWEKKETSPYWGQPLAGKLLITNYAVRELTDPYLDPEEITAREQSDRARAVEIKNQATQMCARVSEMERVIQRHPEHFDRLTTVYGYNPADLTHPLTTREMDLLLTEFPSFEKLMTLAKVTVCELVNTTSEVRELVLDNLYYIIKCVEEANMSVKAFLQLDAVKMQAFFNNQAHFHLRRLLDKPEYKLSWDFIFNLSAEDYDQFVALGVCKEEVFFFSKPQHTDHLSVKELIAALTKSPKEAVRTFLKVPGNVDKLFARISNAEEDALPGWGSPQSPGGLGPLRSLPKDSNNFEGEIAELSGRHLKGHLVYYERAKEYLPNIIKSLEDLKKVLKWLFPHQCQDVLERLRNSGQLNKLIQTPDDLAQLLNYFALDRKNIGLLIDFEEQDFQPNVLYLGKREGREIDCKFLTAESQVSTVCLSASDLPEITDEQWTSLETGHQEKFTKVRKYIYPALCKRGISFEKKEVAAVLATLDAKVAGEELSFLRRLLPTRLDFQQTLQALRPDRHYFLHHAMRPYLHLPPYLMSSASSSAPSTLLQQQKAIIDVRQKPEEAQAALSSWCRSLPDDQFKETLLSVNPDEAAKLCFPKLQDFTDFLATLPSFSLGGAKKDLLYCTWHKAIDLDINSIHDVFEVSQYLGPTGKEALYKNNKTLIDDWRKAYPQVKDQYLMLLRAVAGYPGYKDEHTPCEQVSVLRKVAACLMVFFWAFLTHLSPASEAEKQIGTLATSEPNFFTSPSKRAAAIFVDGLNERVGDQNSTGFLANHS